jgi:protein required for attachment to host cells
MSGISWIIIADSGRARIFVNNFATEKKLTLFRDYTEKDIHKANSDLVLGDKNDFGAGNAIESSNPKFQHSNLFANALAKRLEHFRTDHAFEQLVLVAAPAFLGLLKEHLSKELYKNLVTVEKDYTHDNEEKLLKHLADYL